MRGVASLAYAPRCLDALAPIDVREQEQCCVCGGLADGRAKRSAVFSSSFTDWSHMAGRGSAMCSPCLQVLMTATKKYTGATTLARTPQGCPGWLIADQSIVELAHGLRGLRTLVGLSERKEPFAVIVGYWKNIKHYWMRAPVAYGAGTWPALWATDDGVGIGWMRRSHLISLHDAAKAAIDNKEAVSLKTIFGTHKSEALAGVAALADWRDPLCPVGETEVRIARRVLTYIPSQSRQPQEDVSKQQGEPST